MKELIPEEVVEKKIYLIRGQKIILRASCKSPKNSLSPCGRVRERGKK
ncbi:MAG: hypothetical protein DDT18_01291 [Actinobacteria bacterium]|nr:hypothetical protein [Actinomycetota bacterium]